MSDIWVKSILQSSLPTSTGSKVEIAQEKRQIFTSSGEIITTARLIVLRSLRPKSKALRCTLACIIDLKDNKLKDKKIRKIYADLKKKMYSSKFMVYSM